MPNNIVFLADSNAAYRPCDPIFSLYEKKYPTFAPVLSHHFVLNSESFAVCHYRAPAPVVVPTVIKSRVVKAKKPRAKLTVEVPAPAPVKEDSVSEHSDWYDECEHYDYEFEAYVKISKKAKASNWSQKDKIRRRGDPSGYPSWVPADTPFRFVQPALQLPRFIDSRDFPSFERIAQIGVEAASSERATPLQHSPEFIAAPINPQLQRVREAWAAAKHPKIFLGMIEEKPDPIPIRSASQVRRLVKEGKIKEAREMSQFLTDFTYDAEKKRMRSSSPLPDMEDTIPEHPKSSKYHASKPAHKKLTRRERGLSMDSDWEREIIAERTESERNDLPPRFILASATSSFVPVLAAATRNDSLRTYQNFADTVLVPLLNNQLPEPGPSLLQCNSALAIIPPDGGCVLSSVLSLLRLAKPLDFHAKNALTSSYIAAASLGNGMMSAANVDLLLSHVGWKKHFLAVRSACDFSLFNVNEDSLFYTVSPSGAQGHLCSLLSVNLRSKAKNRRVMICPWFVIRTYTAIMNHQTYGAPLALPDGELHHPWNWNEDIEATIVTEQPIVNVIDTNKLQPHWNQDPAQKALAHHLTVNPLPGKCTYEPKHNTKKPLKSCVPPPERKKPSAKAKSQAKRKTSKKKAMLTNICLRHEVQSEFEKPNAHGGKSKEFNRRRQARKVHFTIHPKAQTATFSELRDFTEKFSCLVRESVTSQQMPLWLARVRNFVEDNGRIPRDCELYPRKLAIPAESMLTAPELTMQEVAFKATTSTTIPVISDIQRLACLTVHPTVPANIAANHMLILLGFIRKQGIAHGLTDIFLTFDTPVCQTVRDLAENILTGRAARAALRTAPPKEFGSIECPRLINSRCTASTGQLLLAYSTAPRVALSSAPPINTARIVQDGYVHPNPGGVNAEAMVWARNSGLKLLNGSDNNPYKDNQGHAQMRWFNDLSSLAVLNQMPSELSDKPEYIVLHDIGSKREGFLRDLKLVYDVRSSTSNTFVTSCFQEWTPNAEVIQKNDLLTLSAASSQSALPTQAHFPFESTLRRIPDREEQFWRQFNALKKTAVLDPITVATREITNLHYSPYIEYFSRSSDASTLPQFLGLQTGWNTGDFQSINNLRQGQYRDFDRLEMDFDNLPEVEYEINSLVTQVQLLTLRHKRDQALQGNFAERPGRDPNPDEYIDDDLLEAGDDESIHSGNSNRDPQERPNDQPRLPPNANRQQVGNPGNGRRANRFWARVDANNNNNDQGRPPMGAIGVVKLRVSPTNNPTSAMQGNVLREYRRLTKEFMKLLDFRPNNDRTLFISSESFYPDSLLFLLQLTAFFQSLHRASPHVTLEFRRLSARRSSDEELTTINDKVFWDDAVELLLGFSRLFLAHLWSSLTSDEHDLDVLGISTFNVYLWVHSVQSILNSPFLEFIGCCSPDSAAHWDNVSAMNNLCSRLTYMTNHKWIQLLDQSSSNNAYLALSRLFQKLTPSNLFYFDFTFDLLSWTGRLKSVFFALPGHGHPEAHQKRAYLDYNCWRNMRCWVLNKNVRDGTQTFLRWCNSPFDPLPGMVQALDVGDEILRLCAPEETIDADGLWNAAYLIACEPRHIEFSYFVSPVSVPPPGFPLNDVEGQEFSARQALRFVDNGGLMNVAQLLHDLPEIHEEDDEDDSDHSSDWLTVSNEPAPVDIAPESLVRVLAPVANQNRMIRVNSISSAGDTVEEAEELASADLESMDDSEEPLVRHAVIRSIEFAYIRLPDLTNIQCPQTRFRIRENYWTAIQTRWRNDLYPSGLFWNSIQLRMSRLGMNNWIDRMEDNFEAARRLLNPVHEPLAGIPQSLSDFIQFPPESSTVSLKQLSLSQHWTEFRSQYPHTFPIPIVMLLNSSTPPTESALSVLPLLLDVDITTFLDSHKLLWSHQARASNHGPTFLSVGFAPNTPEFQRGVAEAFANLSDVLFTSIRQLISQPTPSYSNFISKNKYGCTRELERLMASRRTENSLHRVHAEKSMYNNSTLSQGLESLLNRLLAIQPVITSRPWDIVPCDIEYNRSHPLTEPGFIANAGHTSFWHSHLVGTLSELYPYGSSDYFVLRANDVHYYLTEEELHRLTNAHVVITGMNYDHCWPTRYRYPWGNGTYRIFPDTALPEDEELAYYRIQVETGGSGASAGYDHPLNNIANPHKIVDLGWCSVVTYSGAASAVQFNRVVGPRHEDVCLSPQDHFFSQTCSKVSPELVRGSALQGLKGLSTQPLLIYVSKINGLLSCPSEALIAKRLDAILNICGSHASSSYNFIDSDTPWYRKLLGLTRVWTLAKTEGVSPPPTWHIPLPEFFFGKHRGFIEKQCTRLKFSERQLHVAHFGAIEPRAGKISETTEQTLFRKKISDPLRIENSDLTIDQKRRPYTNWLMMEDLKPRRRAQPTKLAPPTPVTSDAPANNMIPLHIETRPFQKTQLQLNESSDNSHNVNLVKLLAANIDWNERAQPHVKFYPSIGYHPSNHSLRPISSWTIDHKSPFSLLSAIHGRHFLPKITPHPEELAGFDAFVGLEMKPITDHVCSLLDSMQITETIMEHYMAKDYDANKKDCYIRTCMAQLSDPLGCDFSFSFLGMVKSNEENYTSKELKRDENQRLIDVDERARLIWNPSETGKGLLNYIQSFIFTALHEAFPDFVHGASCSDTRDLVLERVNSLDDPISVSLDGSGYDSTQFASLQEIVDTRFFKSIRNSLHSLLLRVTRFHNLPDWPEEATDKLLLSATSPDATLFIIYPKKWLEGYKMSREDNDLLSRHWPNSRPKSGQAICSYKVSGTTFSGHPTKTTLGNTLRSLFYYKYAFRHFLKPVQMLASGDDIVIWTERAEKDKIVKAVRAIASQTAALQIHGLGQIVKKIEIKEKFDLEFCSKMFFSSPSTPLVVTRDLEKLMKTKLCASTSYQPFVLDPGLFMQSLYESALSEIPCPYILEILRHRLYQNPPKGELTAQAIFRAKILSKGFFKKSMYSEWQSICNDPDIQEQMILRTNIFRPDVIDYVLQHNQVVRFGGIETLGSDKPHSCSSIKSSSSSMNRKNGNNRGRKQAPFYYEAYIPNPGQGVEVKVVDNPDHSMRKTELEISANKTYTDDNGSCHLTLNSADLSALESKLHEASRLSGGSRMNQSMAAGSQESSQTIRRGSTRPNPGANRSIHVVSQQNGGNNSLLAPKTVKKVYDASFGPGHASQRSTSRKNNKLNNSIIKILNGDNQSQAGTRDTPRAFSNVSNEFAFQGGTMINPPNYQQQLKDNKVRHMNRTARLNYYSANPMAGTLAPFTNNGPFIQDSADLALSDTDRFMMAKYFPGRIDTPYMNGLSRIPIPTSRFSSSFSLTTTATATGLDTVTAPIGTFDFLMLAYCPSLSLSVGSGVAFAQSTITHLSGFQAAQGNLADTVLYANGFDRTNRAPSLLSLLGTNFDTFSSNGIIFASELDMRILTPQANLVGTMYTGCCTLASIPPTGLSIQRLIQTSSKIMSGAASFKMRGALVNNALATTALTPNTNDVFADYSNEIVHYVILQTPVISITTGIPARYTLICNGHGNYAYWPSQTDAFANKLGTSSAITSDTVPSKYDKLNYDPTLAGLDEKSAEIDKGGHSFVNDAMDFLDNSFEAIKTIGDLSVHSAPFLSLLATPNPRNESSLVEKAWALRWIDEVQSITSTCGMDWICEGLRTMTEGLNRMRILVDEWPSPLVPSNLLMAPEAHEEDEFKKIGSNSKPFANTQRPALPQNDNTAQAGNRPN